MAVCISLQFFVRSADPPVAAVFLILIFEAFQSVTPRLAARPRRRASERADAAKPRDASLRLRLPSLFILAVRWPLRFPSVAGSHASHLCVTFILDQWISAYVDTAPRSSLSLHSDSGYSGLPFPLSLPLSGAEENVEPISRAPACTPLILQCAINGRKSTGEYLSRPRQILATMKSVFPSAEGKFTANRESNRII